MLEIIKKTVWMIRKNMASLMIFTICYHIAVMAIVFWISSIGIKAALKQAGYSYLTTENLVLFLQKPITIGMILLIGIIVLLAALFEITAVFVCCESFRRGQKLSTMELLFSTVISFQERFRESLAYGVAATLFFIPIINLQFLVFECVNVKIVTYIIQNFYEKMSNKWIFGSIIVLIMGLCLCSVFVLPHYICTNVHFRMSFKEGMRLFTRHFLKTCLGLLAGNILLLLFATFFYLIFIFFAAVISYVFYDSSVALAVLLNASDWIEVIITFFVSILGVVFNVIFLYNMYLSYKEYEIGKSLLYIYSFLEKPQKGCNVSFLAILIGGVIAVSELTFVLHLVNDSTTIVQGIFYNTQITAHRAGASEAPENTIAGLMYAVEVRADYAEIDVQETKDGVVILLHDNNLKRTTGRNQYIWDTTYAEVETLDAGKLFGQQFKSEKIPTLEEALIYSNDKIDLNIELKYNQHEQNLVETVVGLIETYHFENQCVITSTYYPFLQQVKEYNPNIKTGYIAKVAYGDFSNRIDADFLSIKHTYVTKKLVDDAHNSGKEVHVWTVNSRSAIERMKQLEVDNIITDRPVTVREVLASEMGREGFVSLLKYVFQ